MQAEQALTEKDIELLWSKGFLGDHSPKSLLNTIFHLISFTMCSGITTINNHYYQFHFISCFVSLFVEPIAGKKVSPSDNKLWQFLEKILSCREIGV